MEKKSQKPEDLDEPVRGRSGSMEQEVKREDRPDARHTGKGPIGGT